MLKIKAAELGIENYKLANAFITFGLWVHNKAGLFETHGFVKENYPLIVLSAVRNELSDRGFPEIALLDAVIQKVEAFLEKGGKKNESSSDA
jgi:hypothetical protein